MSNTPPLRLGIMGDTHNQVERAVQALHYFREQQVALVLHTGDWTSLACVQAIAATAHQLALPLLSVLGNNDAPLIGSLAELDYHTDVFWLQPAPLEITRDGHHIVVHHGHQPSLARQLMTTEATIIIQGHTHKPQISWSEGRLLVNPGSLAFSIPRAKSWRPSVATIAFEPLSAQITFFDQK